MATALDVAKYVLEQQGPMTTLKLEKLVYYAQAWSVAEALRCWLATEPS